MELDEKLDILAPAARFDACDSYSRQGRRYTPRSAGWGDTAVATESGPDGRAMPTFRLLMSSRCAWNCPYCPLRAGGDPPRAALEPEELARTFLPRHERGTVQGLFLSSAVDGDVAHANNRMLDGIEHLRRHHSFGGYVHVKLLPGASAGDIERAARLASRVSINLEAPNAARLAHISPERRWDADLIAPLVLARDWQRAGALPAGLATQFVVGAAGESDSELLSSAGWLYRELAMRRIYYGAFRPAAGTPLADLEPTPFIRSRRLQEADWLLRHYEYGEAELPYDSAGNLPLHLDPKLAWALAHAEFFPVELNTATEQELLRVPGLGPTGIRRIMRLRREHRFREPAHLAALGSAAGRARDFVTFD
ncbi:MAG TPA: helix-hairpin-helix domain-containing protein, partial [Roseiflexaceae bacterium]|nr:helix-hairpin-helix domain-containing protein [Roseiflexaceae bacterium]